jgi:hypothetical protein
MNRWLLKVSIFISQEGNVFIYFHGLILLKTLPILSELFPKPYLCMKIGNKIDFYLAYTRTRSWVDNIRLDLEEVGWGDVDWIGLAKDRNKWRALVNSVLNLRVP